MRTRTARGSFLDPRTKILIWLLANVVVFTWAPAVFRVAVMLAYFGLFLLERKGKMLAGLLLVYLVIVASAVLAAAAAARLPCHGLCHGDLFHSGLSPALPAGLTSLPPPASASSWPLWSGWGAPELFHHSGGDPPFLPALRQDFRHIRDAMALRRIHGLEEKLECIYVPMLWGQPRQRRNSASPPPLGALSTQGKCPPGGPSDFTFRMWWSPCCSWPSAWVGSAARGAPVITFDHVTYTYEGQETPSLRDCSFTVEPGELILLTGESGCGKTTIIKLVNGLLQHGEVGL